MISSYTEPQQIVLNILSDGKGHKKEELINAVDDLMSDVSFRQLMWRLRNKLPESEMIVCVFRNRQFWYMHVRKLHTNNE